MGYCFVMIFGYSQGLKKHTTLFQTYNEESQAFSMGLYLCICTYICKYVAGGAYMPLAGTSRVQGIKVGFKGVKEEPYWKVLIVTDRHTDLYGCEGQMLQTDRETF